LDPIEQAIRGAFAKGDASDPAFREKVYRSAFAALDRALKGKPDTTVERAIRRRKDLEGRIAALEEEFAAPRRQAPEPADDVFASLAAERDAGRTVKPARPRPARSEPRLDAPDARPSGAALPEREELTASDPERVRCIRGRRGLGLLVTVLALFLLVAAGGWWVVNGGLPMPGGGDGTPPRTIAEELAGDGSAPGGPLGGPGGTRGWVSVFSPADPSTVGVPEGGEARAAEGEGIPLLRVRGGGAGEPVRFAVAREVLARFAGRRALFDIVARTEDGRETQAAVACDFGGFGACSRKRYTVSDAVRGELLFEVAFPEGAPKAGGAILLDPDVTGKGGALDVYEIRVSPSE
jgi:hypothetical protein